MGTSLKDFAKLKRNTEGKFKDPKEPKITHLKFNPCAGCGFDIKSAIVRSLFFDGDWCTGCIKEMKNDTPK